MREEPSANGQQVSIRGPTGEKEKKSLELILSTPEDGVSNADLPLRETAARNH